MKKKAPKKRAPRRRSAPRAKKWLTYARLELFVEKHALADWPDLAQNHVDKHHTAYVVVEDRLLEAGNSFSNIRAFLQMKHAELYANSIFGNVEHRILTVTSSKFVPARPVVPVPDNKQQWLATNDGASWSGNGPRRTRARKPS